MRKIHVVFDGPPAHESGRFVEVEEGGRSINFGEWKQREDGYWVLEFYYPSEVPAKLPYSKEDVKELVAALRAVLIMYKGENCPMKLDEALTWRENDEKATKMADEALAKFKGV